MPDVTVQDLIRQEAKKAGVPEALALAVAEQESGFNPTVLGPKLPSGEQAVGTFQVLPSTAKTRNFDPNDPVQNIRGGVGYLRELLDQNNGDLDGVLKTYGGVKTDTEYVPGVIKRLKKFQTAQSAPSGDAGATTAPVETPQAAPQGRSFLGQVGDAATEFGKSAVNSSTRMMDMVRQRVLGLPGERPQPFKQGPTSFGGKVGRVVEPMAEFGVASALTGGLGGGMALQIPAQAGVAHAVAKAQGASDTGANVSAVLAGSGPAMGKLIDWGAPIIRQKAAKQLARTFSTGLENKGPMVNYALKTGEAATPEVAKSVQIIQKAASDTLDLPIQSSWGKWQTTLAKDITKKGQALEDALKGPLGDVEVPKSAVLKALNDLEETTKHIAEVQQPAGAAGYAYGEVIHNKQLADAIRPLREQLEQYADHITLRNLTDIKRTWDSYVYTLSTAGKVGLSSEAIASTAMKEAMLKGAHGIRAALETAAPDVAKLNSAVTDAIRLQDLVQKLYAVNPAMNPGVKNLATAAGAATGVGISHALGMPGWGGSILGAHMGGAATRMLLNSMESPLWQTLSPKAKDALAQAIAGRNVDRIRQILTPVLAGTASQATRGPVASPPAGGTP